jgi:L-ascorbate metabolism protein UlaG (beta-lactamase superfamily)
MRSQLLVLLPLTLACSKEAPSPTSTPSPAPTVSAATAPVTQPTDHFVTAMGDLSVTPLQHASVRFEWHGEVIYVDPTTVALADPLLPKADVVFVTHTHPDHFDPPALERLRKSGTVIVGPQDVADKARVDVVMKNGDTRPVGDIVATAIPMYNLQRGPQPGKLYHEKGHGNGYVLDFAGTRVYLSGDTECTPEMKTLDKIDVAFVCMNLPYTMPPGEAARCIEAFRPKVLFPYHYRGSDLTELDQALAGKGIEIRKRAWYPGGP